MKSEHKNANAPSCSSTKSSPETLLLRHLRARISAQRTGDLLPAARRGRGGGGAHPSVGRAPRGMGRRTRTRTAARSGGGSAPHPEAARLRRLRRRLSRTPRPSRGTSRRTRAARRLQPARFAGGHARERPAAVPARLGRSTHARGHRPARPSQRRRRRRGYTSARALLRGPGRPG